MELIALRKPTLKTPKRLYSRAFLLVSFVLLAFLFTPSSYAATVKGEVVDVQGTIIELDIGSDKGIKAGDTGRVYYTVTIVGVKEPAPVYVANFKITHPTTNSSMAKIEGETTGEIKKGYLVEVTVQAATQKPTSKKVVKREPKAGEVWKDPHLGMEFVWVPGGCYEMGDLWGDGESDERPIHKVCLDGFWMGRYEVTQGQWQRLMGNNPSYFKNCGNNCPVENVSDDETVDFARRLSERTGYTFRLPTEAEWEYACRSGGRREKYSGGYNMDAVAWHSYNSGQRQYYSAGRRTHPVGSKSSNGLGIYDMSGNVSEWCLDWFDDAYYSRSPLNNPQGPSSGEYRVGRGGSWFSGVPDRDVRCSERECRIRTASESAGFRLVRVGQ